jgi:hypothetical protein
MMYRYVLCVFEKDTTSPVYMITLESSFSGGTFIGEFDGSGGHANLGPANHVEGQSDFLRLAIEHLRIGHGLHIEE